MTKGSSFSENCRALGRRFCKWDELDTQYTIPAFHSEIIMRDLVLALLQPLCNNFPGEKHGM